jgi:hypothetical protein
MRVLYEGFQAISDLGFLISERNTFIFTKYEAYTSEIQHPILVLH